MSDNPWLDDFKDQQLSVITDAAEEFVVTIFKDMGYRQPDRFDRLRWSLMFAGYLQDKLEEI